MSTQEQIITSLSFSIGNEVYLKTDPDQLKRIVTGVMIRPNGISYGLTSSTIESWHYDFEISEDKIIF